MAYDGFEAIREEQDMVPVIPLKIMEPIDDRQLVIKCSGNQEQLSQVKIKRKKTKPQNIPARETRSKTVKPSANTRSKSNI
jgi:hypothetical protein